jgi:hypothetical protein
VELDINGSKVADWKVGGRSEYAAPIPPEITKRGGEIAIELKIPQAFSLKSVGMGEEARILGVSCFKVFLTEQ